MQKKGAVLISAVTLTIICIVTAISISTTPIQENKDSILVNVAYAYLKNFC